MNSLAQQRSYQQAGQSLTKSDSGKEGVASKLWKSSRAGWLQYFAADTPKAFASRQPPLQRARLPALVLRHLPYALPYRPRLAGGTNWNSLVAALARCYPCSFALITRTASCSRQLPSCVAVYPRDARSLRVLCRWSYQLQWSGAYGT